MLWANNFAILYLVFFSEQFSDKDECSNPKLNECSKDTTCVNQIGRYICKCVVGYEADKGSKATAIDIKCIGKNIIIFQEVLMRLSSFKITSEMNHYDMGVAIS